MSVKEEKLFNKPSNYCNVAATHSVGGHSDGYNDVAAGHLLGTLGFTDGSGCNDLGNASGGAHGGCDRASNHDLLDTSGCTYEHYMASSHDSLGTTGCTYEHDVTSSHNSLGTTGSIYEHDIASSHDSLSITGGIYEHDEASNHDSLCPSGGKYGHYVASNHSLLDTSNATCLCVGHNNLLNVMGGIEGHDVTDDDSLLMDRLDELLESEQMSSSPIGHRFYKCVGEEYVEDNMILSSSVDDILFSSLKEVNEEMPQLIMDSWTVNENDDIDPSCINYDTPLNIMPGKDEVYFNMNPYPEDGIYPGKANAYNNGNDGVTSRDDVILNESVEEESVSQIFSKWLKSNSHAISLADLRKIKLKTSTIEDAVRRLGGGKKGLMLFVKCILMWIQNFHVSNACNGSGDNNHSNNTITTSVGSMELPDEVPSNLISVLGGITTPYDELDQHNRIDPQVPASCYNSDSVDMNSCTMMLSSHVSEHMVAVEGCTISSSSSSSGSINTESFNNPFFDKAWNNMNLGAIQNDNNINSNMLWPTNMSCSSNHMVPDSQHLDTNISTFENADMVMVMQPPPGLHADISAKRAARKSRMERQRWSVRTSTRSRELRSVSSLESKYGGQCCYTRRRRRHQTASSVYNDQYDLPTLARGGHHGNLTSGCTRAIMEGKAVNLRQIAQFSSDSENHQHKVELIEKKLKLLFHKELKQSDVGSLGRIVLPKKHAESCLPYLEFRDGVNLAIEDFTSPKIWSMRYRFWPNNKSRMYLIENTGEFVKSYKLREGDYMLLYFNLQSNRYVMLGAKGEIDELLRGGVPRDLNCSSVSAEQEKGICEDTSTGSGPFTDASTNPDESCDDPLLVELIEQSLEDLKDSPQDSFTVV